MASSLLSSMPPVSMSVKGLPRHSQSAVMRSRVTPGLFSVMEILRPATLLKKVLFPTLGRPTMAMTGCMTFLRFPFIIGKFFPFVKEKRRMRAVSAEKTIFQMPSVTPRMVPAM